MAYSEQQAERIRKALSHLDGISEKKMFGGLCFLLHGKMVCGVMGDDLLTRVDPSETESLLKMRHVHPMDFTGRPMKGFVRISPPGYEQDEDLKQWLDKGIERAIASRTK